MSMFPPDQPDAPLGEDDHAEVAARLQTSLTGPSLDPATRQRHLQAIRARAASLPAPAAASSPVAVGGWAHRLASTVAAVGLVVVLGASGAVAASHDALPGQALHPVKLLSEQLVLAAPMSTQRAVDRHLLFADRRLDEAATLAHRDAEPALVAEAITAHARLLTRAGELADDNTQLAARVDAAATVAHRRLALLLDEGLPEVAADRARAALSAAEARLDRRPAAPSPAETAPDTPDRGPDATEQRPTPPAPVPPDRTPPPAPQRPGPPTTTSPEPAPPERTPPGGAATPAPRPAPDRSADPGPPEQGRPEQERERQPSQTEPATPSPRTSGPQRAPSPGQQPGEDEAGNAPTPRDVDQPPTERVQEQPNRTQPATGPAR